MNSVIIILRLIELGHKVEIVRPRKEFLTVSAGGETVRSTHLENALETLYKKLS